MEKPEYKRVLLKISGEALAGEASRGHIDGVYSADPKKVPDAVKYDSITYADVLAQRLQVMDSTATSLSMDNKIPVLLFALKDPENILRAVMGEKIGTIVQG